MKLPFTEVIERSILVTSSFPAKMGSCLHFYPPDRAVPVPWPQAGARLESPGPRGTLGAAPHGPLSLPVTGGGGRKWKRKLWI